jgi:malto-oligosyltrehalose synthase/4-alpha-glucanotransferase
MLNPISTYRIQFNKEFKFSDFKKVIPYLHDLGIQTIYASPIMEASPGSMHGYDTVNPLKINPEIGTEEELLEISSQLKSLGMNWIQDIVPNHMAYHQNNPWLMDVLEKGQESPYYSFFDINWSGKGFEPIMTPFLGDDLEKVIENGELKVVKSGDKFQLDYSGNIWPLNDAAQQDLANENLESFNSNKSGLVELANRQNYRLCNWMETDRKINYRRFFTVNSLICLNIQDPNVFKAYHEYIFALLQRGIFQGLRVDHIDGLFDPNVYLELLRESAGADTYIVIEKILEQGEEMPIEWPVQGTTGYDFLATMNNVFTNQQAEEAFSTYYKDLSESQESIESQIWDKKRAILENHMGGELSNLVDLFQSLGLGQGQPEVASSLLKEAIAELLIHCPVYRYYGDCIPLTGLQEKELLSLLDLVNEERLQPAVELLKNVWFNAPKKGDKAYNKRATLFYKRCMQFSGPLMAKGVEDTLMYTYNRFIGKNEVGDSPEGFGLSPQGFHDSMKNRIQHWPMALSGSSTHDTKRGEDVRARLNVLTDLSSQWLSHVQRWNNNAEGIEKPDLNDIYFIYQTLVGSHPMPGVTETDYQERVDAYLQKALREAKRHTGWAEPSTDYEKAAQDFSAAFISNGGGYAESFEPFFNKVADYGILNSLSQVVVKYTAPGVPDVYQGTELWDLSLVDPDNRRPVDYEKRTSWLAEVKEAADIKALWEERYEGKIKLWLQYLLLQDRKQQADHYKSGSYLPLEVKGKYADNILAYARKCNNSYTVVLVPLHPAVICEKENVDIFSINWKNTRVELPSGAPENWQHLFTQEKGTTKSGIKIQDAFKDFPLAVLKLNQPASKRGSGILMHITSLPSAFGIGDIGKEAYCFVDFLKKSGQKYWQLLPLNPITASQSYSPYSPLSSMAGNVLLISPETLLKDGLLSEKDLKGFAGSGSKLDYQSVEHQKFALLDIAYQNFKSQNDDAAFQDFCKREFFWLDDFALFSLIKEEQQQRPWNEWPSDIRKRKTNALNKIVGSNAEALDKIKWLQFIFFKQFADLKQYAHKNQVKLIGDLPFYISYDSVDVWAHPQLFKLDEEGNNAGIAGVPPDYFNEDGQLWGMPVYRWDVMAKEGYAWWKQRLQKNMELFDLLRLDHFRAFASYWEVPAGEETAINGKWLPGPGAEFFEVMRQELGKLPFIAEDLGDIDDDVYVLRDGFEMPGMKVLQFAFGDDMASSIHIPHQYETENCVVYTGTHDNTTTRGWFKSESTKENRRNLELYLGKPVTKDNVHFQLIRLAFASTARLAIIPVQDVLGLGKKARMNTPSSTENNWGWRLGVGELKQEHGKMLHELSKIFGRL